MLAQLLSFSILACLSAPLRASNTPQQNDLVLQRVCSQKLEKRYNGKAPSENDQSIGDLLIAAQKIVDKSWRAEDDTNPAKEHKRFREFVTVLREPSKEKRQLNQLSTTLQAVLFDPSEIAHILVVGDLYGMICPDYRNPEQAATHDVYLAPATIRYYIRIGTLPSMVSYKDEQRKKPQGPALIRTAADTEAPPAPAPAPVPPAPQKPKGNFVDEIPPENQPKLKNPSPSSDGDDDHEEGKTKSKSVDPYNTLNFLGSK